MFFFLACEKILSVSGRNKGLWAAQSISRNSPSGIQQKGRGVISWEEQIRGGRIENYLSVFPQRNSKGEQGAIPWEEQIRGGSKAIYLSLFPERKHKGRGQGNLSVCPERRAFSQAVFSFVLVCSFLLSLDRHWTLHFRTREPEELLQTKNKTTPSTFYQTWAIKYDWKIETNLVIKLMFLIEKRTNTVESRFLEFPRKTKIGLRNRVQVRDIRGRITVKPV